VAHRMRMLMLRPALAVVAVLLAAPSQAQTRERTATPSSGLLVGSKNDQSRLNLVATALRGTRPPDRSEAAVLAAVPDRAFRDGPILTLKLGENRQLKITDCNDQNACRG